MDMTNGIIQENNHTIFKKKNNYWTLDFLKYILAIVVVVRHCFQAYWSQDSLFVRVFTCSIPLVVIPTLFAISGFLLFRKEVSTSVLKKQEIRVIKLYLIWCLIYTPLIARNAIMSDSISSWLISFLKNFFFSGAYYHLWFLTSLVVALCLTYIFGKILKSNKYLLLLSLLLYVIGTMVDTYHFFPPFTDWHLYKDIFLTTRNGVFFGFLFVTIGKIIAQNLIKVERMKKIYITIGVIFGLLLLVVEVVFLCLINSYAVVNMNFSSVILAPMMLIIAIKMTGRFCYSNGKEIRDMSTVLFCCHPWVMSVVSIVRRVIFLSPVVSTIMALLFTIATAYVCVKLSKRFSILRNLM